MDRTRIKEKTAIATRWSAVTEIIAKLITPLTTMALARLLTPDAFGVVASVTMIVSFAEMLADAGFQKYIVQHDFLSRKNFDEACTVAFWTTTVLASLMWISIILFCDELAELVGCPGQGLAIAVSGVSLLIASLGSLQTSRFKRDFDFKLLFSARLIYGLIPLFVSVPIAVVTHSFWSLIIGTICGNIINVLYLSVRSTWRPRLFFSFSVLREMFSYSFWILLESITLWLTTYIGVLLVGTFLSQYDLGLYKTSISTVEAVTAIVTSSTAGPLFSALSRLQNDERLLDIYYAYIRSISVFLVPLCMGMYLFADCFTFIFLGSQWLEASRFVGLLFLSSSFCLILGTYYNGLYNATGKTRLSFLSQIAYLMVLAPSLYFSAQHGFDELCISHACARVSIVIIQSVLLGYAYRITPLRGIKAVAPAFIGSAAMIVYTCVLSQIIDGIAYYIFGIAGSIIVYFLVASVCFKGLIASSLTMLGFGFIAKKLKLADSDFDSF